MKKILFFTFVGLLMALLPMGRTASVDTLQLLMTLHQSVHMRNSLLQDKRSNVTKAEGDSAYMRNDYASAIQIYESSVKRREKLQRSIIILEIAIIRQMI